MSARGIHGLGSPSRKTTCAEPPLAEGGRSRAVTLVSDSGQPIRVALVLERASRSVH